MTKTLHRPRLPQPDSERVPAEFQIVESHAPGDFQFLAAAGDEGDGAAPLRRFTMTAYTGGKLLLASFPYPVVVDLSGLKIPAKSRPILRDHDSSRIVGHTESIEINGSSLRLAGVISGANEHAREVTATGDNGFPWQSSIGASAQRVVFVDRGEAVEVNGRRLNGPLYVARQATLREISFVALGADDQTVAQMVARQPLSPHPSIRQIEVYAMEFEQWVQAQGFDATALTEQQADSLRALWQPQAAEPGDPAPAAVAAATFASEPTGEFTNPTPQPPLVEYFEEHPDSSDLICGPLLRYGGKVSATQQIIYASEGVPEKDLMGHGIRVFGTWFTDRRGLDPAHPPFEIMKTGLGAFACRSEVWPGFHESFSGYGGGELFLCEKFRQQGNRVLCLPSFRWWHNFMGYDQPAYARDWKDWARNTLTTAVTAGDLVQHLPLKLGIRPGRLLGMQLGHLPAPRHRQ